MERIDSDKESCTKKQLEITYADLPLACPPLDDRVWDAHPRVYLPIDEVGTVVCPYCGTDYVLKDFDPSKSAFKIMPEKKISAKILTPEKNK